MFRSTEESNADATASDTIGANGIATPYFMLVQMNNAALLEAYATLGIVARPARIDEVNYPAGFDLDQALAPISFGSQDRATHPGALYQNDFDPIQEAEASTNGTVDATLALATRITGRFASRIGSGGLLAQEVATSATRALEDLVNFDPAISSTGMAMLYRSFSSSSARPDWAGSAPFTGFRVDYRPETAPDEVPHEGPRPSSLASTHHVRAPYTLGQAAAAAAILATRRHHGKAD